VQVALGFRVIVSTDGFVEAYGKLGGLDDEEVVEVVPQGVRAAARALPTSRRRVGCPRGRHDAKLVSKLVWRRRRSRQSRQPSGPGRSLLAIPPALACDPHDRPSTRQRRGQGRAPPPRAAAPGAGPSARLGAPVTPRLRGRAAPVCVRRLHPGWRRPGPPSPDHPGPTGRRRLRHQPGRPVRHQRRVPPRPLVADGPAAHGPG
jgi:hypothetical protein